MNRLYRDGQGEQKHWHTLIRICGALLVLYVLGTWQTVQAQEKNQTEVIYYYYSTCESCTEGEDFERDIREKMRDVVQDEEYVFILKDVSETESYEEFQEAARAWETEDYTPAPPALQVGETILFGYDEIAEKARDLIITEVKGQSNGINELVDSMNGIDKNDAFFVYFYVPGCADCQKAQGYFDSMDKTFYTQEGALSHVKMVYVDIGNIQHLPLAQWFYEKYRVPKTRRKAPLLFYQQGYLQGFEEIKDDVPKVINEGTARQWEGVEYHPSKKYVRITWKDWGMLLFTGLANGWNPCGLSVLFFLISLLAAKKEKIWKLAMTFIVAKWITYLLLGVVFGSVIGKLSAMVIAPMAKALKIILSICMIVFAALNFMDMYFASREKYGRMKMQLPAKLKTFHQEYMEEILQKSSQSLTGVVFIAGIVISAGEFLCTGQLYLASIIYVMEKQTALDWYVLFAFAMYVACMCLPLVLLTLIIDKSAGLVRVSEATRKKMPALKLLYGVLFLMFGVIIFLSL